MPEIGATLRNARLQRGLSIEQAAQDTRISARFIEALEAERFDSLPAPVYVRGFLRSYASYLRLDPAPLLDDLGDNAGMRAPAPDSFTPGPTGPVRTQGTRTSGGPRRDPFQRTPPPEAPSPPPAPAAPVRASAATADDDEWEDDAPVAAARELPPEEERFRRRGSSGVLAERPIEQPGEGSTRILAMAAGGILVLLVALAAAVFITSGDDDDDTSPASSGDATATPRGGSVVAVGSRTPTRAASPSPAASGTPTPTGTPGTPTPTVGPGTPTPTPQDSQPTPTPGGNPTPAPTPTPGDTATPTPTATPAPPTATPTPPPPTSTPTPRPTPTPSIPHPVGFSECVNGNCGDPPFTVVCAPDGWFLDVGANFPAPAEWPRRTVNSLGAAASACG